MRKTQSFDLSNLSGVIDTAKVVARRYRELTGRPLGITGEVAEVTAANLLGLELAEVRQSGYDATRTVNGKKQKIQIKGRCITNNAKRNQRVGSIQLKKEWDSILLVLLDADLEPLELYEATRSDITRALKAPGSKARNIRGQLSVSKFTSIADQLWPE